MHPVLSGVLLTVSAVESSFADKHFLTFRCSSDLLIPNRLWMVISNNYVHIVRYVIGYLIQQALDWLSNVSTMYFYSGNILLTNQMFQRFA